MNNILACIRRNIGINSGYVVKELFFDSSYSVEITFLGVRCVRMAMFHEKFDFGHPEEWAK